MEDNPLIFKLSKDFEYTKGGDFSRTSSVELRGPGMGEYKLSFKLSQYCMRAIMEVRGMLTQALEGEKEKETGKADENQSAQAVKMFLFSSKSVDFSEVADVASKLFLRVGTYDGQTSIKEKFFNSLSIEEFTNMVCEYIANFIFPSLFPKEAGEKKSGNI